eukprot:jgi/Picsp_1/4382/NSC_01888-R1_trna nucleotidyltransferase (cca-adding enzyme)
MYHLRCNNTLKRCILQCGRGIGKNVRKERMHSIPGVGQRLATAGVNKRGMCGGEYGERNNKPMRANCGLNALSRVIVEDDVHGIRDDDVLGNAAVWHVLTRLRQQGHECFLVGGTVRDFILGKRKPKDFDVLTSAEPYQVSKMFKKAFVLGKSFPIVHVHFKQQVIEVSSFSTNCDPSRIPLDAAALSAMCSDKDDKRQKSIVGKHQHQHDWKPGGSKKVFATNNLPSISRGARGANANHHDDQSNVIEKQDATWAMARRENARKRDFTVNGLLYDPFSRILFDYVEGLQDCKDLILRTIADPEESFKQDPARMLRAIRLSARSNLLIESEMGRWLYELRELILNLSQSRLQMELHAMMSHGAAAESFSLLDKYKLLETMLPHQFRYIHDMRGNQTYMAEGEEHVFRSLLKVLDSFGSPACPLESSMWIAILAAPIVEGEYAEYIGKGGKQQAIENDDSNETKLEVYHAIVDETMLRLLTNTDFLNANANDTTEVGASKNARKSPCLLPRQAVESAANMLKLEADVRGHSDVPDISPKEYRKSARSRKKRPISGKRKIQPAEHVVLHVLRHNSIPWKRAHLGDC